MPLHLALVDSLREVTLRWTIVTSLHTSNLPRDNIISWPPPPVVQHGWPSVRRWLLLRLGVEEEHHPLPSLPPPVEPPLPPRTAPLEEESTSEDEVDPVHLR